MIIFHLGSRHPNQLALTKKISIIQDGYDGCETFFCLLVYAGSEYLTPCGGPTYSQDRIGLLLNVYIIVIACRREGEKRLSDHIAELKKQLAARDQMIQRLQKDLTGKEQVFFSPPLSHVEVVGALYGRKHKLV